MEMASNLCMNEKGVRGANEGDDSYYSNLMENPKVRCLDAGLFDQV